MSNTPKYRKIHGGMGSFSLTRAILCVGPDHFLLVLNSRFAEEYRRFYFDEIEGFIARRTNRRRNFTIALVLVLSLFYLVAIFDRSSGAITAMSIAGALPLLLLVLNIALGPTVECRIRTTASEEVLPSVRRLRSFRKLLAKIRPMIEEKQGGYLVQEQLQNHFRPTLDSNTGGNVWAR